jgi:hypothetical protein
VQCPERERLESTLTEMVDRLGYLNKLRLGDPSLDRLTQEIGRLKLRVDQARQELRVHRYDHGCS